MLQTVCRTDKNKEKGRIRFYQASLSLKRKRILLFILNFNEGVTNKAPVLPDGCVIVSIFGHLEQGKFAPTYKIFARIGSQFYQILNSYSRNGPKTYKILPKWRNFAKSGHTANITSKEISS